MLLSRTSLRWIVIGLVAVITAAFLFIVLRDSLYWLWGVLSWYIAPDDASQRKDLIQAFTDLIQAFAAILSGGIALGTLLPKVAFEPKLRAVA
jgi:hypothetical protein